MPITLIDQIKEIILLPVELLNSLITTAFPGKEVIVVGILAISAAYFLKQRDKEGIVWFLLVSYVLYGFFRFLGLGG